MTITRSRQGSPSSAGFLVGGNPTRGAPEIDQKLLIQGLYPAGLCGEEFAAHLRDEFDDWAAPFPRAISRRSGPSLCGDSPPSTPCRRPRATCRTLLSTLEASPRLSTVAC